MTAVLEMRGPARYGPFLGVFAVGLALPLLSGDHVRASWWGAALAATLVMAACWRLGDARNATDRPGLAAALLAFPGVLLLELADVDHALVFTPLLVLPTAWCALYQRGRHVAIAVGCAAATLLLPIALIGAPGYPATTWRRAVLWLLVLGLLAPSVHLLVRSTRLTAARLAAGEQRYRSTFAAAPVAIAVVGADGAERGLILQANPALHDLLGADGPVLGRSVVDFAHLGDIEAVVRGGVARTAEVRLTQASGRQRWVSVSTALVPASDDEPLRYICHLEDITVRRESEQALLEALEKQREAAEQLRGIATARSELVAAVSHDIRNPLSTISAYVQLLQLGEGGELGADQRAMLDVVAQNVARANAITDDLLAMGRLGHAADAEPGRPVTIGDVLAGVVGSIGPGAAARGQRVLVDAHLDGVLVEGHPAQLDRVLTNLLTNAVKFTPDGGTVTVRAREARGSVVIEVSDTGSGIPAGEQGRIFERFYRSDAARRGRVAGTGLGLAIAREIATLHGGTVDVRSEPGQGATFTLTLPALAQVA